MADHTPPDLQDRLDQFSQRGKSKRRGSMRHEGQTVDRTTALNMAQTIVGDAKARVSEKNPLVSGKVEYAGRPLRVASLMNSVPSRCSWRSASFISLLCSSFRRLGIVSNAVSTGRMQEGNHVASL